jgi:hypothetical protein
MAAPSVMRRSASPRLVAPQTLTVGRGRALFFRDGRVYEGAWSRAKPADVTSYTIGGQPASFAPGQLWVALIGRDRPVTTTR